VLGSKPFHFDIGGGTYVEGHLDDWIVLWTFMRLHERDEPFQRSLRLLRPGDLALDVGANFGTWSLLAARRTPAGRVHAFEPVPEMVERLRRHVELNGAAGIIVNQYAIGGEDGSSAFFAVREKNTGESSFVRPGIPADQIVVPVVTLDTYVAREGIDHVDLLKVDVEGAEILVFKGARRLLSSDAAPIVFFEVDRDLCARFGTTPREVKQLLVHHGYGIYRWRHSAFVGVTVDEPHGHEDLFALKPHHLARMQRR